MDWLKRFGSIVLILVILSGFLTGISVYAASALEDGIRGRIDARINIKEKRALLQSYSGRTLNNSERSMAATLLKSIQDLEGQIADPGIVYSSIDSLNQGLAIIQYIITNDTIRPWWNISFEYYKYYPAAAQEEYDLVNNEINRLKNYPGLQPFKKPPSLGDEGNGTGITIDVNNLDDPNLDIPVVNQDTPTPNAQPKDPNPAEKVISGIFISLGDFFYNLMKPYGMDLDTVIFNKSPGYYKRFVPEQSPDGKWSGYYSEHGHVSPFMIDFSNNKHPFAQMANVLFILTKLIAIIGMFLVLMYNGGKLQFSATSNNKVSWSETLMNYVLSFSLIFAFPWVFEMVISILNLLTDALRPANGILNILKSGEDLGSGLTYFAMVFLNFYFAAAYGSRALHMIVFFALLPIMAMYINSPKFKKKFEEYMGDFSYTALMQPADALIFFGLSLLKLPDSILLKLILIGSVIPVRAMIKRYLGFTQGSFMSDMLGMAAITSTLGLVKGFAGGTKEFVGGITGGASDMVNAQKGRKMAGPSFMPNADTGAQPITGQPVFAGQQVSSPQAAWQTRGGIDIDKFGKAMPQTAEEAARELNARGVGKIFSSFTKATGGLAGAGVGALAGLPFGASGVAIGANLGSTLGAGAGSLAGRVAGAGVGNVVARSIDDVFRLANRPSEKYPGKVEGEFIINEGFDMPHIPSPKLPAIVNTSSSSQDNAYDLNANVNVSEGLGIENGVKNDELKSGLWQISKFPNMDYDDRSAFIQRELSKMSSGELDEYLNTTKVRFENPEVDSAGVANVEKAYQDYRLSTDALNSYADRLKNKYSSDMEKASVDTILNSASKSMREKLWADFRNITNTHKKKTRQSWDVSDFM